jgi:hypothetical protein
MGDTLVPFHKLPVDITRITLCRWIAMGTFPAPADTISGRRYWSQSDLSAWSAGKRRGWLPDAGAADRKRTMLERARGNVPWAEAVA